MRTGLPESVCFRVTRACNARCRFCLAPWDGAHPSGETLHQRLDWLLERGVRIVHFCGGEPTIHPALAGLVDHMRDRGATTRLTTNGIALPDALLPALRRGRTHVKVSLHGEREWHDAMVGREAFDLATATLRRLLAAGVTASVQTTVVAGGRAAILAMVDLCLRVGVRRLSLLPFIPRGDGRERAGAFGLSTAERRALRDEAAALRRALSGRLDVRWLDFNAQRVPVVEADGRVILEGASEASDEVIDQIGPRRLAVLPTAG